MAKLTLDPNINIRGQSTQSKSPPTSSTNASVTKRPVSPTPKSSPTRRDSVPSKSDSGSSSGSSGASPKRKKLRVLPVVLVLLALIVVIVAVVSYKIYSSKPVLAVTPYESTGRYVYDTYLNSLINYDQDTINAIAPTSYIAQEWDYANNNSLREQFVKSICSYVSFSYPQVQSKTTAGDLLFSPDGSPSLEICNMNNNEAIQVTVVDYEKFIPTIQEDKSLIQKMWIDSGYSIKDYEFKDEVTDLLVEYMLSKSNFPTYVVELSIPLGNYTETVQLDDGTFSDVTKLVIADDSQLDKLLFSTDAFHKMCDTFAEIATDWNKTLSVEYSVQEEIVNPEWLTWKARLDTVMSAYPVYKNDKNCLWEPFYLRDENDKICVDENGNDIVNYYILYDDQGTGKRVKDASSKYQYVYLPEPEEKVLGTVAKEKEISWDYLPEDGITYTWIGAYYSLNEHVPKTPPEEGDGSFEYPLGVGSSVVTKAVDKNGKYHDVRIKMTGYWAGEDATAYAVGFSEKNRGFDSSSVVSLICYEIEIENLENTEITLVQNMCLTDKLANQSSRTGTMYGFTDYVTIPPHDKVIMQDWATSTEIDKKYVVWGKYFDRQYDVVVFKLLAGNA